jgi:signal transduction histidine kinase
MRFRSIRSRLALSFAGIALVAALTLGAVLLAIVQQYYSNLELNYLRENAETIEKVITQMSAHNATPAEMQAQIRDLAFITQTRIQVFDSEDTLLDDSGSPQNIGMELGEIGPSLAMEFDTAGPSNSVATPVCSNPPCREVVTNPDDAPNESIRVFSSNRTDAPESGFALNTEAITQGARSNFVVAVPLQEQTSSTAFDPDNDKPLGSIRLSEGPAYGRAILGSVARGWGIASMVAVLLAAGIGSYISRLISAPVLALRNVTGRMAQGDLSSRASVESQDEIGQLALSFNEMADQVETTVTTLRRFVADAAHELRTPLTVLRSNLNLVLDEKKDAASRAAFAADAKTMIQRLEELNTNLLDLSRVEAHDPPNRDVVVDLTALLQRRNEIYASRAEQAGLVFEQDLPTAPVFIRADSSEIMRAIDNLVDNAFKFTPQDGTIGVTLSRQDEQASISVADTGIGILEDDLPQLFSRFHRGRNSAAYFGSGLGLAIVKAIVIAHGGHVEAQSAGEGKGSKFSIKLPVVQT